MSRFKEQRSLLGLDLYEPSIIYGGRHVEEHARLLFVRMAERRLRRRKSAQKSTKYLKL